LTRYVVEIVGEHDATSVAVWMNRVEAALREQKDKKYAESVVAKGNSRTKFPSLGLDRVAHVEIPGCYNCAPFVFLRYVYRLL